MELKNKLPKILIILIVYTALVSFVSIGGYKAYVRNKLTQTWNDAISNISFGQYSEESSESNDTPVIPKITYASEKNNNSANQQEVQNSSLNTDLSNNSSLSYSSDMKDISNDVEIGEIKTKCVFKKDGNGNPITDENGRGSVVVAFNITNKTDRPIEGLVTTIDIKNNYGQTLGTIIYNATNELVPQKVCTIGTYAEFKGEKVRLILNPDELSATVRKVEIKK